ncbi:MAG TPA: hypothetical protein VG758_22810 [Hyphomicrobiaceae bacterium]|jgi:hypothetical protein|nr:hypothetical protein [Hyphomicrobiaceae bacterium]
MDFMAVSCICLPTLRLWLSKSAERHRRPPLDLRIGAFAPEFGDGFQVPPAGAPGTLLLLACEFGTHLSGGCVPSMPLLGLASFCLAPAPPGLWGSFLLRRQNWYGLLQPCLHPHPGVGHASKQEARCASQLTAWALGAVEPAESAAIAANVATVAASDLCIGNSPR